MNTLITKNGNYSNDEKTKYRKILADPWLPVPHAAHKELAIGVRQSSVNHPGYEPRGRVLGFNYGLSFGHVGLQVRGRQFARNTKR